MIMSFFLFTHRLIKLTKTKKMVIINHFWIKFLVVSLNSFCSPHPRCYSNLNVFQLKKIGYLSLPLFPPTVFPVFELDITFTSFFFITTHIVKKNIQFIYMFKCLTHCHFLFLKWGIRLNIRK